MTPVEIMTKAYTVSRFGKHGEAVWNEAPDAALAHSVDAMRAALLALAAADLSGAVADVASNNPTVLSPTGRACVQAEAAFRALLRALAEDKP